MDRGVKGPHHVAAKAVRSRGRSGQKTRADMAGGEPLRVSGIGAVCICNCLPIDVDFLPAAHLGLKVQCLGCQKTVLAKALAKLAWNTRLCDREPVYITANDTKNITKTGLRGNRVAKEPSIPVRGETGRRRGRGGSATNRRMVCRLLTRPHGPCPSVLASDEGSSIIISMVVEGWANWTWQRIASMAAKRSSSKAFSERS